MKSSEIFSSVPPIGFTGLEPLYHLPMVHKLSWVLSYMACRGLQKHVEPNQPINIPLFEQESIIFHDYHLTNSVTFLSLIIIVFLSFKTKYVYVSFRVSYLIPAADGWLYWFQPALVSRVLGPVPHRDDGFISQILWKYVALIWEKIIIRSCHNFAHTMTAGLSWHVQSYFFIGSLYSRLEQQEFQKISIMSS